MRKFEMIVPCHFGTEAMLKKEIINLGYKVSQVEDGRVTFFGDEEGVARANIFLRTGERVLIKVASFFATTYEQLFDQTKEIPWESYIPQDGKFWVAKAASIKSKLFSPSDIQSIMKKAMVESMKKVYGISWFQEDKESYPLRVFIKNDMVTIGLDTTGESLHKRGYRKLVSKAPIAENLAAALLMLTPWNRDRILVDPFCGSGTIPIEAALMSANIAPGMNRSFRAITWTNLIGELHWKRALDEAKERIVWPDKTDIQAFDSDYNVVKAARENAKLAGVDKLIHFQQRPIRELNHPKKYGFIVTNPPYGERLEEKQELLGLYKELGEGLRRLDSWSAYIITAFDEAEKYIGKKAVKNRKIYNGMIKTYFYQFPGPKPPTKRERHGQKDEKK
ncbi:MAG: class I SAM-dependent RNA methyltransferase [Lachnospiraceae bacterium]|jgi:putative N6-adenine-specific DNA methylase|nr:class I SAM-dependent RNA methyltransferase [Lachnospiraceae bacterium]